MPTKKEYIHNEKYEVKHWDWAASTRIGETITKINQIRKENEALQYTNNFILTDTDNANIFAHTKKSPEGNNIILCVVNLDFHWKQAGWIKVPLYELGKSPDAKFKVHDLISEHTYHWQGEWNYVELSPQAIPGHVFRLEFENSTYQNKSSKTDFFTE